MSANAIPFIRPLRLPEILDQAVRVYRRNFVQFVGIIAIPYIPLTLIQTGLSYISTSSLAAATLEATPDLSMFGPSYWLGLLGSILVGIIQIILVFGVATAALTRAVADGYSGRTVGILAAYRNIGKSWLRLLGAVAFYILAAVILMIWTLVPCIGWLTGPGALFFLAGIVVPLIAPVVVLEKHDVLDSLRRAWDLGRSRFWWLVGFVLVLWLLSQVVVGGPVYLINILVRLAFGSQTDPQQQLVMNTIIQLLVGMVTNLLYLPLRLTAMTLVYFDLRVRAEGFDLALQAAGASGEETDILRVAETSPQPQAKLVTGADTAYFALLTLVVSTLFGLFFSAMMGFVMASTSLLGLP